MPPMKNPNFVLAVNRRKQPVKLEGYYHLDIATTTGCLRFAIVRLMMHLFGMSGNLRLTEIQDVDAFIAEPKTAIWLDEDKNGQKVESGWAISRWKSELCATWVLKNDLGISRGQIRFSCRRARESYPTLNLIFRGNPIWRVEIEDPPISHRNPYWAANLGCPPIVSGSHEHSWPDNRNHVLQTAPNWDIPCRRPIQPQIRRLSQAILWFASSINLSLESDQRDFDVPPQKELF